MRLNIFLFAVLLFPIQIAAQRDPYIGYKYKPVLIEQAVPNGLVSMGGAIVGDPFVTPSIGIARFRDGNSQMLWLDRSASHDSSGVKEWMVLDVLRFPYLKKNQDLLFGTDACRIGGKEISDLIVFVSLYAKKKTYAVIKAWKADLKNEKFKQISTSGISCEYYEP